MPRSDAPPRGKKKGKRSRLVRAAIVVGALLAFLVLAAAGTLFGIFYHYGKDPNLPTLNGIGDYRPEQIVRVLDREGKLIGELGALHRTVVSYDKIPKVMIQALLAAEDAEYFEHEGIDYKGMVRAFVENVIRRKFAQGASTITQQVVKQLLLTPEKSMRRKVQEIILARRLSQRFSKEEVLALYLNQMYFGHGRYGVEEAARYFFGKSISDVDTGEAALLAGLVQSPERLSPYKHPEAAKKRQIYVLGQMAKLELIYEDVAKKVAAAPITVIPEGSAAPNLAPEAVDLVRKRVDERFGPGKAGGLGIDVKTTIDSQLQALARQALERGLEEIDQRHNFRGPIARLTGRAIDKKRAELATERRRNPLGEGEKAEGIIEKVEKYGDDAKQVRLTVFLGDRAGIVDMAAEPRYSQGKPPPAERFRVGDVLRVRLAPERRGDGQGSPGLALELGPQAAMVVLDPTRRDILALVGGYGYRLGGFDRSLRAERQPGSAFKPFIYAAAIDSKRYTAASIVNDSPEVFKLWKPQNHEKAKFRGPVRLRVALADSINTVSIKLLSDIGILSVRELATTAGLAMPPVDKLDLSLALGTLTVKPIELANAFATFASGGQWSEPRIVTAFGNEAVPAPESKQVMRPEVAFVTTSLLRSVVEMGTARSAAGKLKRPAAGKTGTTDDNRDAWFVGFTPELLAAVWVGFDERRALGRGEEGAHAALPIWTELMTKALAGTSISDFAQPSGVVVARIDPATGLLPAPGSEGVEEVFVDGTAPTDSAAAPGEETNPDELLLGGHDGL
jgi:penicillin-binding protein 1A